VFLPKSPVKFPNNATLRLSCKLPPAVICATSVAAGAPMVLNRKPGATLKDASTERSALNS
jgi:hypothetical protein